MISVCLQRFCRMDCNFNFIAALIRKKLPIGTDDTMHQQASNLLNFIRQVLFHIKHWNCSVFFLIFLINLSADAFFIYQNKFSDSMFVFNQMAATLHAIFILTLAIIENNKVLELCENFRRFLNECECVPWYLVPLVHSTSSVHKTKFPTYKIVIFFSSRTKKYWPSYAQCQQPNISNNPFI